MTSQVGLTGDDVVLLDAAGRPTGAAPRLDVHSHDTPLHLAFSSYLFDDHGRVLLTRRALGKRTWPGVWTNSCCGHPQPEEDPQAAIERRVRQELGVTPRRLECLLPDFRYRARDAGGVVENELCPVWVGRVSAERLQPNPDEVMDHVWLTWPQLREAMASAERVFSPWASLQVPLLDPLLAQRLPETGPGGGVDLTRQAVDARLLAEGKALGELWERFVPHPGGVLPEDLPTWLDRLATSGGKRFRVDLSHWGFVASGGHAGLPDYQHLITAAAALEMVHYFALVHDDVMDQSDTRRGRPAAHVQASRWHREHEGHGDPDLFGQNVAILLGDLAHAVADRLASALPPPLRDFWFELNVELIAGQRADLSGAAEGRRDLAHAERIADLKSGSYSVERPLQLGALAAHATADARSALAAYGRHLGRAFALRDDLLGIWGDPELTGKPVGDDLRSGKSTVIAALAAATLSGPAAAALSRIGTAAARPEDVDLLVADLVHSGVRDRVERMVAREASLAQQALVGAPLTPEGAAGLHQMAERIAWRQS